MDTRTNAAWITAFAAYLTRRFPGRATTKHYVNDMQIFVRAQPKPLPTVTRADIDAFVDAEHACGCAPATVKRCVAALIAFFAFLAEELDDPARINPASMRRHAGRQPRRLPRDLANAEVAAVPAVIADQRDLAMVSLMRSAGLRIGEVAALRQADLTVPEDPQALIRLRVLGKGRQERVVYLLRQRAQALHAYLQADPPATPHAPLFRSRLGRGLTVAGIAARIRSDARQCGVAVTAHRVRHTDGRWMAEGEMPVLALRRLLGHASIHATQRYIDGADPQVQRQYADAMAHVTGDDAPEPSAPALPPAAGSPAPVTVTRPAPTPVDPSAWLPEAPAGIRQPVLDWLQHQLGCWKPSQRRHHARVRRRALRAFWRWQLAQRPLTRWADVTTHDLAAFLDAELARGVAPATVKTTLDRVYEVLRYLAARGELDRLPARPPMRLPEALPRHLTPAEAVALETSLASAPAAPQDAAVRLDRALYALLGRAGVRSSEALELQVQDRDLEARRVRVRDGKGRRDRVVYLSDQAVRALRDYLPTVPHAPGDLVLSVQGRPLRYDEAWARVRAMGQAAGVAGGSPHRLRHTDATQLLNHGMSLEGLRCLMGHDNLATTLIDARLADTTLERQYRAAMERIAGQGTERPT